MAGNQSTIRKPTTFSLAVTQWNERSSILYGKVTRRSQSLDLKGCKSQCPAQSIHNSIFITVGVTYFAANESAVSKWVMNRPFQIRFVESLIDITNLSKTTSNPRKCLRPSEVLKSNKIVENIVEALTTQFINPFSKELDKSELYNLVSGCPVPNEVSDSILNLEKAGEEMFNDFQERLSNNKSKDEFFDPIKKCKSKTFLDSAKRSKMNVDGKCKEVIFQRDILGKLVALSHKRKMAVDLDKCLVYPLAPVSLPLSTPDGAIRKTVKSKLFNAAM